MKKIDCTDCIGMEALNLALDYQLIADCERMTSLGALSSHQVSQNLTRYRLCFQASQEDPSPDLIKYFHAAEQWLRRYVRQTRMTLLAA